MQLFLFLASIVPISSLVRDLFILNSNDLMDVNDIYIEVLILLNIFEVGVFAIRFVSFSNCNIKM